MLEDNKALVRRFVEEFQAAGKAEVVDELVAADLTHHSGPAWAREATVGAERVKQLMAGLRAAFPDLHVVIHDQIAEDDKVVTRKTFYGTHRGEFRGISPTGKQVSIDIIDIVRVTNGQIAEHWNATDWMGLLQQLQPTGPGLAPRDQVMAMITGYWASQVCGATARLGLADHLAGGPATIAELAAAASADPDGLGRLLRAAATIGLVTEDEGGRFSLTPPGAELTGQAVGSLGDVAIALTAPGHWLPWGRLPEAVISGQPQDTAALGTDVWAYYAAHPEEGASFARAMSSISAEATAAVLGCWDATRFRRIVDVGGSQGSLLAGLLDAAPSATGILFDRPEVTDGAHASLARLAGRVDVIGGDFLEEVPPGGDLYVLKSVLHDWDDQRALQILRNIYKAARPGTSLAIIEGPLPSSPSPSWMHLMNLLTLVELNGRERTTEDYARLLGQAGYRLDRVTPTAGTGWGYPWTVMEATRR